jgi:hypothetical protein
MFKNAEKFKEQLFVKENEKSFWNILIFEMNLQN